jgi:hypothetical protein
MIYVHLMGGLGNQCFQYAAGRALSLASGQPLKLDLSEFRPPARTDTPRSYELGKLKVEAELATLREERRLGLRPSLAQRAVRKLLRLAGLKRMGPRVLADPDHRYRPLVASTDQDTCLNGYWASEKYFLPIAELLRRELSPREGPSTRDAELLQRMGEEVSVSVHVRRGDYVSRPAARDFHGLCGEDFYRAAALSLGRSGPTRFYVFSDDIDWCRGNLGFLDPAEFVDHHGPDEAQWDMRLMSACRHHVVANSSLSWWGAWLNPRRDKRVLAPAHWFSPAAGVDTRDMVPETWERL